jgi:hypothetical protein
MNHLICRIENFEIVALYTLRIVFDDHSQQIVDFQPVPRGGALWAAARSGVV